MRARTRRAARGGRSRRAPAPPPSAPSSASSAPGSSPTTRPVVFAETESVTFAPSASSRAFASSREKRSSVPVMTYVLPVSGPSRGRSSVPSSKRSPSSRSSWTRARFCSSANHSTTSSARSGPKPSTSATSSGVAAITPSTVPKWLARLRASTQPIPGMFRPSRTRENGTRLERSIDSIAALAEISANPSSSSSCSLVRR